MTPAARERWRVRLPVLLVSAAAWMVLVVAPHDVALHTHGHLPLPGAAPASASASVGMLPAHGTPASLAAGWTLMLVAMMVPLLAAPVRHLRDRSFTRRRARAIVIFLTGYAAVWTLAGAVLLVLALPVRPLGDRVAVAIALVAAVVWQCSPLKQRCLNRGHAHPELAASGAAADIHVWRFGLTHGFWCVGSCWALMLLPLLFARGGTIVMAAVSLWLVAERIESPTAPSWRLRVPAKAARLTVARGLALLEDSAR